MNHLIIVVDSHDVPLGETGKMPQPHLEHSLGVSQVQEVLNPTGLDNFKRYCVELTFYNCWLNLGERLELRVGGNREGGGLHSDEATGVQHQVLTNVKGGCRRTTSLWTEPASSSRECRSSPRRQQTQELHSEWYERSSCWRVWTALGRRCSTWKDDYVIQITSVSAHLVSWSRAEGGMMILPPASTSLLSPPGIMATG